MSLRPRTPMPLVVLVAVACVYWAAASAGVRFNASPSIPVGLYRLVDEPVRKGSLVAACLPEHYAIFGRQRGYLHRGRCPGDAAPVVKRVGAVRDDTALVSPAGVFVEGRYLQAAAPAVDSRGRPLVPWPAGACRLARGELWLYSPRTDSWDSRFFGPVHRSAVLGTVRPVWTAPSSSPASTAMGAPEGDR